MATTKTILGTSRKLLNDIVWSHSNRPYNNLSNPSYAEVAFFYRRLTDCGRKQGVTFPSTSHTLTDTRKCEKGGKEVSLSFSKKCPLCPRPDNGRLHDRRKAKTHEKKKKRLQDVLARYLISYIGTYEIYHKTTR